MDERLVESRRIFSEVRPIPAIGEYENYADYLDLQGEQIRQAVDQGLTCYIWRGGWPNHGKSYIGKRADEYLSKKYSLKIRKIPFSQARDRALFDEQQSAEVSTVGERSANIDFLARVAKRASSCIEQDLLEVRNDYQVISVEGAVTTGAYIEGKFEGRDAGTSVVIDLARREGVFTSIAGQYILNLEIFHGGDWVYALGLYFRQTLRKIPATESHLPLTNVLLRQFGRDQIGTVEERKQLDQEGAPTHLLASTNIMTQELADRISRARTVKENWGELVHSTSPDLRDHFEIYSYILDGIARDNPYLNNEDEYHFWYNNPTKEEILRTHDEEIVRRVYSLFLLDTQVKFTP